MKLRSIIFWLHLIAGITAGSIIGIMAFTGAMLAFEKEIVNWADRDARKISPPENAQRLSVDALLAGLREKRPGERPATMVVDADPRTAVTFGFGRTNALYANPYTGELRESEAKGLRGFMDTMIAWHRYLGKNEANRATGKAITGACNAAFLVLAISGLYLWWPRKWTRSAVRAVSLMDLKLRGKARDWNWHNAVGLWCAPILIVLTATALPISYRRAGDLIYRATGTTPPEQGSGAGAASPAVEISRPAPDAKRLDFEALFLIAQKEVPQWTQISLRPGGQGGRGRAATTPGQASERDRERQAAGGSSGTNSSPRGPQPVVLSIKEKGAWPLFATTQLTLDPFSGAVLRKEGFGDFNLGRQVRSWTRFLHTGEALGPIGQAVAGLASLGTVLLVWTGLALAFRRFFMRKSAPAAGALVTETIDA